MRRMLFLLTLICVVASTSSIFAGPIADSIAFQGRLTDASDIPVPDGPRDLTLSLWTDPVGGTMLHSEVVVVTVSKGLYSTCIGCTSSSFFDIFTDQSVYLQVQLAGSPPMTPRTTLRSVPFSVSTSGVHGEATNGAAKARGIISVKSATGSGSMTNGKFLLDADSDGDGVAEASDSTGVSEGAAGRRLQVHNLGSSGEDGVEITPTSADRRLAVHNLGSSGQDGVEIQMAANAKNGAVKVTASQNSQSLRWSSGADSAAATTLLEADTDGDGVAESSLRQYVHPHVCESRIEHRTGSTTGTIRLMALQDSTSSVIDHDSDNDGIPEDEISQSIIPGTCSVAIKTKGTGADNNLVLSQTNETSSSFKAINTKGTGATVRVGMEASDQNGVVECSSDIDGDGVAEGDISSSVTPTTCSVAIKTKGTGADNNLVLSQTDETSSSMRAINTKGTGATVRVGMEASDQSGVVECSSDIDGDGIPEGDISSSVTPTTCGVAIKTKGTGADANRTASTTSSTEVGHITTVSAVDDDGDGIPDESIEQTITGSAILAAFLSKKGYDYYQAAGRNSASLIIRDSMKDTTFCVDGDGRIGIGKPADAFKKIDVAGGAYCDGATWVNASDANAKENFQPVDGEELLEKISALEITRWNYKGGSGTEHIGPTAQDFQETFGVGSDGKSISTIDPSGIALAAIKELNKKNERLERENQTLRKELDELKKMVIDLAKSK